MLVDGVDIHDLDAEALANAGCALDDVRGEFVAIDLEGAPEVSPVCVPTEFELNEAIIELSWGRDSPG